MMHELEGAMPISRKTERRERRGETTKFVVGIVAFVFVVIAGIGMGYGVYLEESSIMFGICVGLLVFFMCWFIVAMMAFAC